MNTLRCPYCHGQVRESVPFSPHDAEAWQMEKYTCVKCGYQDFGYLFTPAFAIKAHFDGLVAPLDPYPLRWVTNPDTHYHPLIVVAPHYMHYIEYLRRTGQAPVHVRHARCPEQLMTLRGCDIVLVGPIERLSMGMAWQLTRMMARGYTTITYDDEAA